MGEPSLLQGYFPDSPALRRKDSAKERVAANQVLEYHRSWKEGLLP